MQPDPRSLRKPCGLWLHEQLHLAAAPQDQRHLAVVTQDQLHLAASCKTKYSPLVEGVKLPSEDYVGAFNLSRDSPASALNSRILRQSTRDCRAGGILHDAAYETTLVWIHGIDLGRRWNRLLLGSSGMCQPHMASYRVNLLPNSMHPTALRDAADAERKADRTADGYAVPTHDRSRRWRSSGNPRTVGDAFQWVVPDRGRPAASGSHFVGCPLPWHHHR